jgi:hypothetical protein
VLCLQRVNHWNSKSFSHVVGLGIFFTFTDICPLVREGSLSLKTDKMAETCSSSLKINVFAISEFVCLAGGIV